MGSLRQQTLALLGQEFLAQALYNGGSLNSVVADVLLQPKRTGKEIAADALTGKIRSDAAVLRQGAKNASEAAGMAEIIKNATFSLGETLSEMQTLAQTVQNDPSAGAALASAFRSLAEKLAGTVTGAQYNGISLLDADGWVNDGRLAVSGGTATVSIQMGNTASGFTLRDLSGLKDLTDVDLETIASADLDALVTALSAQIGTVTVMSSGYQALAGSYTSEAGYMEQQADTLALAAERARPEGKPFPDGAAGERSLQSILVDLLLRDQGKLVDTSS